MSDVKKVYCNEKQQKFLRSRAKRKTFQGGRGSGKTNTLGKDQGICFNRMARAKFVMAGLTYVQLDTIVIPEVRSSLADMGIYEYSKANPYGCYVVGLNPPAHWPKPYKPPGKLAYQHCITFINGYTFQLVSFDRPETSRGLNFDGLRVDESALMPKEFIDKILLPAMRANKYKSFSSDPLHLSYYDFSSAPWTQEGFHIYEVEEKYNEEQKSRKLLTDKGLREIPPKYLYLEATCRDNPILPDDYEENLRDTLDPLTFEVEVLNMRITKVPNAFYYAFSTSKHTYFESYRYDYDDKTGLTLYEYNDYNKSLPLEVSLDFNADICWAVVCQEVKREFRVINSNYTKPVSIHQTTNIVKQNAEWFCASYANHEKKEVFIYGDPGGNSRSATTSKDNRPFFDEFCSVLQAKGWRINRRELVSYPSHRYKYTLTNMLLSEDSTNTPRIRINQNTNKSLIIAIQCTPVKVGDSFEKDKSSESKAKHREYATDGTDALDYIIWQKYKKLLPNFRSQKNQLFLLRS